MGNEIVYMLGVVAVGFAVNFALRALPFALFAGRGRALPAWASGLGAVVSPVIICGLIFYSFSGLEWKSAWPYLAGLLTVALQLWRGNSLASIVAGTVVYMCLLNCGCVTDRTVSLDPAAPSVEVKMSGIYFDGTRVSAPEVAEILDDAGVATDRTIPILLGADVRDLREARMLMAVLARAGYRRPVLVTKRHAEAAKVDPEQRRKAAEAAARRTRRAPAARPSIRYKRANE